MALEIVLHHPSNSSEDIPLPTSTVRFNIQRQAVQLGMPDEIVELLDFGVARKIITVTGTLNVITGQSNDIKTFDKLETASTAWWKLSNGGRGTIGNGPGLTVIPGNNTYPGQSQRVYEGQIQSLEWRRDAGREDHVEFTLVFYVSSGPFTDWAP